ncbi:MAG: tetratricopeptide repeat protein [Chloracidobacterium sp.]|nr:tetratricopeptide repeat protein [Chloracidobacterium sp.]
MTNNSLLRLFASIAFICAAFVSLNAQTEREVAEAVVQGLKLFEQERFIEAMPYVETALKAIPDQPELHFMYGWGLVAKSKQTSDTNEAKKLSAQALDRFIKAKELGFENQENDEMIAILSGKAVPAAKPAYSLNKDAEKYMVEAENYFAQSKYDEAIKKYEMALTLDPKIYQAALYGGDSYTAKSDWENAEKWYQRGIAIDPNRETAYRYSGTPLMKQKKYDVARDRYIEAYITEPYNKMSSRGIGQWAEATGAKLGHPVIDVPEITFEKVVRPYLRIRSILKTLQHVPGWRI